MNKPSVNWLKSVSFILLIFLVFPAILFSKRDDIKFPTKKYGELSILDSLQPSCSPENSVSTRYPVYLDFIDSNQYCRAVYCKLLNSHRTNNMISVTIVAYDNPDTIIADALLYNYQLRDKCKFVNHENILMMQFVPNIKYVTDRRLLWISANKIVTLNNYLIEVPDELLTDYLSLFPPTVNLEMADFNLDYLFHIKINGVGKIIANLEEDRIVADKTGNKFEVFDILSKECYCEEAIRSWAGMDENGKYKGCPSAMIKDDNARRVAFDKLFLRAFTIYIDDSFVSIHNIGTFGVPATPRFVVQTGKEDEEIMKSLGITEEEMERHYEKEHE